MNEPQDGPEPASLVRRGAGLAIDLCMVVCVSAMAFLALSTVVPLDADSAKIPIFAIIAVAGAYVVWGRDRMLPSPGRLVFGLRLMRPPGAVPNLLAKPVTIYEPRPKNDELSRTLLAVAVIGGASGLAMLALAQALKTTLVFQAVLAFSSLGQPVETSNRGVPRLADVPRVLLIGENRAYVQVSADWNGASGVIDFFLERDRRGGWQVRRAREGEPAGYGNYSLSVAEASVPWSE